MSGRAKTACPVVKFERRGRLTDVHAGRDRLLARRVQALAVRPVDDEDEKIIEILETFVDCAEAWRKDRTKHLNIAVFFNLNSDMRISGSIFEVVEKLATPARVETELLWRV